MFAIRKTFYHKGYLFLFSVVGTNGFWSTHKYEGKSAIAIQAAAALFQTAHDIQIQGLVKEAEDNEANEFKENSILDITDIQKQ